MPLIRKVAADLWEVRSDLPGGIARVFFTVEGQEAVLLHGFIKKSGRTPRDDLDIAETRLKLLRGKGQTMPAARRAKRKHVGSDFEDFLRAEGRLEEATAIALKRVIAWEFQRAMQQANVSQAEMARRMRTSRAVIRRLLDADDPSVTLNTISKAASVLGKSVVVRLAA
jgi:predicted XRE-type DNA-binding protein